MIPLLWTLRMGFKANMGFEMGTSCMLIEKDTAETRPVVFVGCEFSQRLPQLHNVCMFGELSDQLRMKKKLHR